MLLLLLMHTMHMTAAVVCGTAYLLERKHKIRQQKEKTNVQYDKMHQWHIAAADSALT